MRPRGRKPSAHQSRYEAQVRKAHRMHAKGALLSEVARQFGYADSGSLTAAFRLRGLEVYRWSRTPWLTKWDKELERHVTRGGTFAEFATKKGINRARVGQRARDLGIKRPKPPIKHGTSSGYQKRGCRCNKCREWNRRTREAAVNRRWGTPPKKHGFAGYEINGCRCEICSDAIRQANRRQYLRRKEGATA